MTSKVDNSSLEPGLAARREGSGKAYAVWHWLVEEVLKTYPVFAFFLAGFLIVLLIIKLSLAQYSIEVSALSRALLGAALAAKTVLILENTPLAHPFRRSARVFAISCKSLVYGSGVIALAYLERIFDAARHSGRLEASFETVIATSEIHRLLALSIGIALVFAVYFAGAEVNESIGRGGLRKFFLGRRDVIGGL